MPVKNELQIGDVIEYVDREIGGVYTGTVMAVYPGNGWIEVLVRIYWAHPRWIEVRVRIREAVLPATTWIRAELPYIQPDRFAPTWIRVSRVRQICSTKEN